MKIRGRHLTPLCMLLLFSLGAQAQPFADTIYTGGPIVTMHDSMPRPELRHCGHAGGRLAEWA